VQHWCWNCAQPNPFEWAWERG